MPTPRPTKPSPARAPARPRPAALAVAALVALAVSPCGAEPLRVAPGLWEMTTRTGSSDPTTMQAMEAARSRLARMPPEQRRQVEQALAGRGIELRFSGEALTARLCITREMAERDAVAPFALGNCRTEPIVRQDDSVRFRAICSAPRSTVEGITTLTGPKSFESRVTSTVELGGTTRQDTVEQSGRWIGADCGGVVAAPAPDSRPRE